MRLIEESGGILNTSTKEFPDAHAALVETMVKEGETVSLVAGSRMDRRTVEATLKALEERGKVKIVSTVVSNEHGLSRAARVVYLPETSPEKLQAFLEDLGRNLKTILIFCEIPLNVSLAKSCIENSQIIEQDETKNKYHLAP